ncbi:MAG TPA: nicotinamide riboside transporter PnuC [Ohtaekwangia sp.]|nr:nicotinamide riboside transporter PnuC [Ohtaekwangia sp.]
MNFFDIDNIFFTVWNYPVSYLEFFGWLSGVTAITLSAFGNIWYWPIGIINVILSFFLFFQVQLYPDMFLQMFFFVTNLWGWWRWAHPKPGEENKKRELRVSFMKPAQILLLCVVGFSGTIALGFFARSLHELFPVIFTKPSAAPFLDSFITVMSIVTTFYVIQKKIESWIVWIIVDMLATYLYFIRDIKFYSFLYLIFTIIAAFGLYHWIREYRNYARPSS